MYDKIKFSQVSADPSGMIVALNLNDKKLYFIDNQRQLTPYPITADRFSDISLGPRGGWAVSYPDGKITFIPAVKKDKSNKWQPVIQAPSNVNKVVSGVFNVYGISKNGDIYVQREDGKEPLSKGKKWEPFSKGKDVVESEKKYFFTFLYFCIFYNVRIMIL